MPRARYHESGDPSAVVEAVCFSGTNRAEALRLAFPDLSAAALTGAEVMQLPVFVETPAGTRRVSPGDYVVSGPGGVTVMKGNVFASQYERVIP